MSRSKKLQIENDELCRFINREMKMTGNDPRIAELENAMNHKIKRHWWDWPVAIALLLAWIFCGCATYHGRPCWISYKDKMDEQANLKQLDLEIAAGESELAKPISLGAFRKPDVDNPSPTPISSGQQTNEK